MLQWTLHLMYRGCLWAKQDCLRAGLSTCSMSLMGEVANVYRTLHRTVFTQSKWTGISEDCGDCLEYLAFIAVHRFSGIIRASTYPLHSQQCSIGGGRIKWDVRLNVCLCCLVCSRFWLFCAYLEKKTVGGQSMTGPVNDGTKGALSHSFPLFY